MTRHSAQRLTLLAPATVLAALLAFPASGGEKEADQTMVYELRTYTTVEGRLPALHARFRDHTLRLFEKHGMKNVAYWTPLDGENTLIYLVAHASRQAADKSWEAFVNDPEWKKARDESERDGKIVAGVERQYLAPTDYSPIKSGGLGALVKKKGVVCELRTYTTNKGKLAGLHARFRDHTLELFKKHGMANLLYTTPLDEKTASSTLVYFVAHLSREAADQSWQTFRKDPVWQKAYRESIADGKLVKKVESRYLVATDYSPEK